MLLVVLGFSFVLSFTPNHYSHTVQSVPVGSRSQSPTVASTSLGPNIDIAGETPSDRQRVETTVAVDPRNPSIVIAGAQDYRLKAVGEHRWHGYYRSTDGGQTWTSALLPGFPGDTSTQGIGSPLKSFNGTSDPVLAFDRSGNLYYAGIAFNAISPTSATSLTAFVAKYVNDGRDYSRVTLITGFFADKEWIAVDTTGGANDGNVYLAFDSIIKNVFGTVFTRSTDGGVTFSTPAFAPAGGTGVLPGVAVDAAGNVYVSTLASIGRTIQVSKLTNGGTTLTGTVAAQTISPDPSPLPGGSFRSGTIPQISADTNGVYLVWDDFRTGNSDVLFARSTDGGTTWTNPLRVNDVTTGQQFFPTIAAAGGTINVAWYDSRFNTGTTMTALDVFYARSTDAGLSFSPNLRVTSVSFNPNVVLRTDTPNPNEPFMGDYIEIAASGGAAHPVWADNRNACDTIDPTFGCVDQDAFTATISQQSTVLVNRSATLDSSRITTVGNLTVDGMTLTVSGFLTVSAYDSVSGALTFAKTYTITGLALHQPSSSSPLEAQMVLNVAVSPYALGSNITVQLQAGTLTTSGLLSREFDINVDGIVDIIDVSIAAASYGTVLGNTKYNPQADFNADGSISIIDIAMIASYYGAPAFR